MSAKTIQQSELHELLITRTFDAPQWLVWRAWTEPEHLMQWCCPNGFTLLHCKGELRVGSNWQSAMRSPEGQTFVASGTYREIVPCERLVFTHLWEEGNPPGPETVVSVHLAEHAGKTTMTFWQTGFDSVESRDGHEGGWSQAFDHLGRHLQKTISTTRELTLTRVFDAPCELVWQAWTDPEHIMQWWGPAGFNNETCESELRVGGRFRLEMRAPDGNVYPCIGTFIEIVESERIVYEGEAMDGHPCGAGIPPRATVTVSFADQAGKTRLTLHTRFASAERKQAAADARFVISWNEALDRLAEALRA